MRFGAHGDDGARLDAVQALQRERRRVYSVLVIMATRARVFTRCRPCSAGGGVCIPFWCSDHFSVATDVAVVASDRCSNWGKRWLR